MKNLLTFLIAFSAVTTHSQIWDFDGINKLAGTVNSEAEESMPIFSPDSSALYFIRLFDEKNKGGANDQDIWVSYRQNDGSYSDCKPLTALNSKYHNGVVGISKTGDVLYMLNTYEGKKDLEKGIAMAKSKGSSWGSPEKIEVPTLDIEGDLYGFHIHESGDVMIISYNGPGSNGEEDLYVSLKSETGWSAPENIGSTINTSGYEMSPFLSTNLDTLFFSSNGHGGLGDADIFYSVRGESWKDWSNPVNLGSKINSPKFDACFSYSGNQLFWSSNRDSERSDIYTAYFIYPPPLTASAVGTDVTINAGSDGKINLTPEGGVAPYTYLWSNGSTEEDPDGLIKGIYTVKVTDSWGQTVDITVPINEPDVVELPVVVATGYENPEFMHYFKYNKNKLSVKKGDLKRFVKEIEKQFKDGRPSITIKVYASASHVPTKTYETNEKLTEIRAENMKYDLSTYFEENSNTKGKVNIVIVSAIVDGPEYEADALQMKKYEPFQFVMLKTE